MTEDKKMLNSNNGMLYLSKEEGDQFDKKTAERAVKFLAKRGVKAEVYKVID